MGGVGHRPAQSARDGRSAASHESFEPASASTERPCVPPAGRLSPPDGCSPHPASGRPQRSARFLRPGRGPDSEDSSRPAAGGHDARASAARKSQAGERVMSRHCVTGNYPAYQAATASVVMPACKDFPHITSRNNPCGSRLRTTALLGNRTLSYTRTRRLMNYVQATTRLIRGTPLQDLARELGVSRGWLAHSRLAASNPQHRPPPDDWEAAVAKLARQRIADLEDMVSKLTTKSDSGRRSTRKAPARKKKSTARKRVKRRR